jgi:hypothetical protein
VRRIEARGDQEGWPSPVEGTRLESGHPREGIGGSNPSPSAIASLAYYRGSAVGEVAELAEGSRLLSGYRVKSSVQGSNPCLSATRP